MGSSKKTHAALSARAFTACHMGTHGQVMPATACKAGQAPYRVLLDNMLQGRPMLPLAAGQLLLPQASAQTLRTDMLLER